MDSPVFIMWLFCAADRKHDVNLQTVTKVTESGGFVSQLSLLLHEKAIKIPLFKNTEIGESTFWGAGADWNRNMPGKISTVCLEWCREWSYWFVGLYVCE